MKPRHTIRLIAAMVGLLVCRAEAAELDYYQRFSSLIDTNRSGGPVLTNGMLSLSELKRRPEIVGVKLGMTMSAAVEHWGKPRNFYANDAGGPLLLFHHGALGFQGDKAVRIGIFTTTIPGLRFDGGLTVTNSPADFAKVLGLPAADPAQRSLVFKSESAVITLDWSYIPHLGERQLAGLVLEPPRDERPGSN